MTCPSTAEIRQSFLWACALDVQARKPGNVSIASPGHGMQAAHFLQSASAAAGPLCAPAAGVGERIEAALRASWSVVHCNTNLGILLLCAPVAAAARDWPRAGGVARLREALAQVLGALDVADARAAYRAIALARPGGLGSAPAQDVADEPTLGLREAMALAADRDRIAWQYVHRHADLFEVGLPAFDAALRVARQAGLGPEAAHRLAMQHTFVEFLSTFADSHIVRKHGATLAHIVMAEAQAWRALLAQGLAPDADPAFAAWDESLKARGLNPGTSADLCVATAFVAALVEPAGRQLDSR